MKYNFGIARVEYIEKSQNKIYDLFKILLHIIKSLYHNSQCFLNPFACVSTQLIIINGLQSILCVSIIKASEKL